MNKSRDRFSPRPSDTACYPSASSPPMVFRYALVFVSIGMVSAFILLQTVGFQGPPYTTCENEVMAPTSLSPKYNSQEENLLREILQKMDRLEHQGQRQQCHLSQEFKSLRESLETLVSNMHPSGMLPTRQTTRVDLEEEETVPRSTEDKSKPSSLEGIIATQEENAASEQISTSPTQQLTAEDTVTATAQQSAQEESGTSQHTVLQKIGGSFEPNTFYPQLTLQDYTALPHHRPSAGWLQGCASAIAKDESIMKPFPTKRINYALGDCIKFCNTRCSAPQGHKNHTATDVGEPFNATMAGYYGHLHCRSDGNNPKDGSAFNATAATAAIVDMFQIFGSRPGFRKPDTDALVVHLRLGDVMENKKRRKRDQEPVEFLRPDKLLKHGGSAKHNGFKMFHTIFSVHEYLDAIDTTNATKVVLVGGSHLPDMYKNSRVYATCLSRALAMAGKQVELQTDSGDADQDFYFMSHAKLFMRSTGGYSRLIATMVAMMGGQVMDWDSMIGKTTRT